ncbi:MAG TPA: ATP-binding protein [Rhizomicrobium sp.]|nr:ATP-binding protein [Rhizomicrobium sp.]
MEGPEPVLYNTQPTASQVREVAWIGVAISAAVLLTLPFANAELPILPGFMPAVSSALVLGDLVIAVLLFSQAQITRSMSLIALGTVYFYTSLIVTFFVLTFPGAFSDAGLFGAGLSTARWLALFRRLGFVIGTIAYVWLKKYPDWVKSTSLQPPQVMIVCVAGSIALVLGVVLLTTIGEPLLPQLMLDRTHANGPPVFYIQLGLLMLTIIAIGLVWRSYRSILGLWLLLALWAMALVSVLATTILARYTLGWYVTYLLDLASNLLLLILLLRETGRLYARFVRHTLASEHEHERQLLIREAAAASIAHELKQPISVIMLNAQVGQVGARPDDREASVLFKEIEEASRRANDTIQSTRALFAHSPAAKQASDINELIRKSLALVSRDLKDHSVSVDLKLGEALSPVALNQLQMQEVFLNLFTNAMEAMSAQVGRPRILTISSSRADMGVVIRVQDTGPGIASEEIEQIFTPFHTTKKSGTGVGLTICQSIVSAHDGSLRVMPGSAEGATFEIVLPYNSANASAESGDIGSSSSPIPPSDAPRQVSGPDYSIDKAPATLGDVLYANSKTPLQEQVWARLVQSIAAGDQLALHELYEMTHRIVFALVLQITGNRETSEELTIDVFHDVWRGASRYDAANGTVLAWIMNLARARAIDRLLVENREKRGQAGNIHVHAEAAADAQGDLALRIAQETGKEVVLPPSRRWSEPEWEQVAPGIECKLLATDTERHRVSMLVRLAPGASYPAHTHAGDEELHLLDGELWIDERKLFPGDYNYGAPGAGDDRVWSETGCTCVLVTSTKDVLRI